LRTRWRILLGYERRLYFILPARERRHAFGPSRTGGKPTAWLEGDGLFWSKRIHDFFEARIAAQWIPVRQQFQLAITESVWQPHGCFELLELQIFFANPRCDDRQVLDDSDAVDGILVHWKQLYSAPSFLKSLLFSPQRGIDQAKGGQRRAVIRLRLHTLLLLSAGGCERFSRLRFVPHHSRDESLAETAPELRELRYIHAEVIFAESHQSVTSSRGVALGQCTIKPAVGHIFHRGRIFRAS